MSQTGNHARGDTGRRTWVIGLIAFHTRRLAPCGDRPGRRPARRGGSPVPAGPSRSADVDRCPCRWHRCHRTDRTACPPGRSSPWLARARRGPPAPRRGRRSRLQRGRRSRSAAAPGEGPPRKEPAAGRRKRHRSSFDVMRRNVGTGRVPSVSSPSELGDGLRTRPAMCRCARRNLRTTERAQSPAVQRGFPALRR